MGGAEECVAVEEMVDETIHAEKDMDPEGNADSPSRASTSR